MPQAWHSRQPSTATARLPFAEPITAGRIAAVFQRAIRFADHPFTGSGLPGRVVLRHDAWIHPWVRFRRCGCHRVEVINVHPRWEPANAGLTTVFKTVVTNCPDTPTRHANQATTVSEGVVTTVGESRCWQCPSRGCRVGAGTAR